MKIFRYLLLVFFLTCLGVAQQRAQFHSEYEVYFQSGKTLVLSKGKSTLKQASQRWEELPNAFFEISGHTDDVGELEENDSLSSQRAAAVKQYLVELGIPEEYMFTIAFGELKPAALNGSQKGRAKNRRVRLILYNIEPKIPDDTRLVKGFIQDQNTDEGIGDAEVIITVNGKPQSVITDADGFYSLPVPEGADVQIAVFAEGYFFKSVTLSNSRSESKDLDITVPSAKKGDVFPFKNMNFYGNQTRLTPPSKLELPKLLKFMMMNPVMNIEIAGHINGIMYPVGEVPPHQFQLSVNRAKVIYEYLVKNGIPPERMTYKGYGNREMIYPSRAATDRQQMENRRVEIRIL